MEARWRYELSKRMPFIKIEERLAGWLKDKGEFLNEEWEKTQKPPGRKDTVKIVSNYSAPLLPFRGVKYLNPIDQSLPRHELVDNRGFTNFKLLLVKQGARAIAQILGSLSYKVCSTPSPKFVIIEPSLSILGKSTIFSQCLVAML